MQNPVTPQDFIDKDMCDYYKVETFMDLAPKDSTNNVSHVYTVSGLMGLESDEIRRIREQVQNYLNKALVQAILSKDDAELLQNKLKIIADLNAMGYETLFQDYKTRWDKAVIEARELGLIN